MKDSMKITIPYQFGYMLLMHLSAVFVTFTFQVVAFWAFLGDAVIKEILGVVFSIVYAGIIYHSSRKLSLLDHKTYTPLKPNVFKGMMFGVCISAVSLVIFMLWRFSWISDSPALYGTVGTVLVNSLFTFWTFPYYGLLGASKGAITAVGMIFILVMPVIATTVGYLAGKYKFDILDKFIRFAYEKEEDE